MRLANVAERAPAFPALVKDLKRKKLGGISVSDSSMTDLGSQVDESITGWGTARCYSRNVFKRRKALDDEPLQRAGRP